jgi:hypothetical protein
MTPKPHIDEARVFFTAYAERLEGVGEEGAGWQGHAPRRSGRGWPDRARKVAEEDGFGAGAGEGGLPTIREIEEAAGGHGMLSGAGQRCCGVPAPVRSCQMAARRGFRVRHQRAVAEHNKGPAEPRRQFKADENRLQHATRSCRQRLDPP